MNGEYLRQSEVAAKLQFAVQSGQIEDVVNLWKRGAPILLDDDGQTALHVAAAAGQLQVIDALIQAGCDVSIQDFSGHTALQRAAAEGHLEILKLLLKNGASIDHQDEVHGNTALHEASWKGFSQSVQILCKNKANFYLKNRGGFAPIHLCSQNGHNETCRILLISGCKPDIKNNYGDTALHTSARYGHAGVVRILVSGKCNPSEQNKNGDTALHIAAAMGRRKLTKVLLESGCLKDIKNKQNETALQIAIRKNLSDIIHIINTSKMIEANHSVAHPEILSAALEAVIEEFSSDGQNDRGRRHKNKYIKPQFKTKVKQRSEKIKKNEFSFSSHYEPFSRHSNTPLTSGEQYFLDLAGNIKKSPLNPSSDCFCQPLICQIEKKLNKDNREFIKKMSVSNTQLEHRISKLERKTKDQIFDLNQRMKESFANERAECLERMDRRALRERISIERQQGLRDLSLKRDLAIWLEGKLIQIERKHGLDAKNAALLRTLALKRFSKYSRPHSERKSKENDYENYDDDNLMSLRRVKSEELLSTLGQNLSQLTLSHDSNTNYKGLSVSDTPRRRIRRNSTGDESNRILAHSNSETLELQSRDSLPHHSCSSPSSSSSISSSSHPQSSHHQRDQPVRQSCKEPSSDFKNSSSFLYPETSEEIRRETVQRQLFPPLSSLVPHRPLSSHNRHRSLKPNLAPLDEVEYDVGPGTERQEPDLHRQLLNMTSSIPLTSDGAGSHDSHNDSGYSTRLGFSAGPSPSLSGSRPESSEGDSPHYLLDPLAINLMPPEFEMASRSFSQCFATSHNSGHRDNSFLKAPKGSLV